MRDTNTHKRNNLEVIPGKIKPQTHLPLPFKKTGLEQFIENDKSSTWKTELLDLFIINSNCSGHECGGDGEQHTAPLHGRQGPTECQWNHKASRKIPSELLSLIAA